MKQETLEEAAEKYAKGFPKSLNHLKKVVEPFKRVSFIAGFKKAEEIMYTEEEVLDLLCARNIEFNLYEGRDKVEEWFNELKKK